MLKSRSPIPNLQENHIDNHTEKIYVHGSIPRVTQKTIVSNNPGGVIKYL